MITYTKIFLVCSFVAVTLLLLTLDFFGVIWHNDPFATLYDIKGIDVSHHQGNIDWMKVSFSKKYSFAFLKATEGNDFVDDHFAQNWNDARSSGLLVGAYHFFSLRSSGQAQAEFFISTVPKEDDSLPPVIDVEVDSHQDQTRVRNELKVLANALEIHYQKRPIFYLTYDTYNAYIKGDFVAYDVWIRDIIKRPFLDDRKWLIWQYSNRGRVDGVSGYVDLNVFRGSKEELSSFTQLIH